MIAEYGVATKLARHVGHRVSLIEAPDSKVVYLGCEDCEETVIYVEPDGQNPDMAKSPR